MNISRSKPRELLRATPQGKLADAQHTLAHEYGFPTWAKLKAHVEALGRTPAEALKAAVCASDAARVRALLKNHPELRARIDDPLPDDGFGVHALFAAVQRGDRATIDVLLEAGADIQQANRMVEAGGFGLLDDCDPSLVEFLVERGAVVDAHASPLRPSPLKSMARTTSPAAGVGKIGRVGEAAVAQAREQAEGVRARVERDERGETTRRECPDGDARGSLQARDRRWVGRPGDAVRPWAGAIEDRGSESSPSEVLQDADLAREPVGEDDVEPAVLLEIGHLDVRGAEPDRQIDRREEPAVSVAREHRDRPVAGVADDQIGHAVAVQVGRQDLGGLGTGGERGDQDETGRAQGRRTRSRCRRRRHWRSAGP